MKMNWKRITASLLALLTLTSMCSVSALAESSDPTGSDPFVDVDPHPQHTFTEWSSHSDTEHVRSCSCGRTEYASHTWDEGFDTGSGTEILYSCTECDAFYTEEIPHEHQFSDWSKYDETQHVRTCECDNAEYAPHEWDAGVQNPEGTAIVYSCTECEAFYSVNIEVPDPSVLYGDSDGNGSITLADAVLLNTYFANYDYDTNSSTVTLHPGGDVNGDGSVTLADAVLLNTYFANYDYDTNSSTVVLGPQK